MRAVIACYVACLGAVSFYSATLDAGSDETLLAWVLRWTVVAAAAALALQCLLFRQTGLNAKEHAANTDDNMVWREDAGITKLVQRVALPKGSSSPGDPLARHSPSEVAKHNTREGLWIIIEDRIYDVTRYVEKHPGGPLPLLDMAGKDCTDVFANYHAARVYKHLLPSYLVGEVSDALPLPAHVADFRAVRQELLRRGLFETDMRFYAKMSTWLCLLFFAALRLSIASSTGLRLAGAFVMGVFWQQLAGVGHDLGHSAVTHVFWFDHLLSSMLASVMGISTCWWKRNHNTHHIVCNSVEHDPDIQHMPIFAVTPQIFEKPYWSTYYTKWVCMDRVAKFLVSYQHILLYPVMAFARFNLYAQSFIQLFSKERLHYRRVELCSLLVYFSWVLRLAFSMPTWIEVIAWLVISHNVAGILHVQIVISHFSMATYHGYAYNNADDEWYITQLKTTMDVLTPEALDYFHIGLQFQIEHHLFPRLPRHNLREAQRLVKGVCAKHKLGYLELGFVDCNLKTLQALRDAAEAARTSKRGESGFFESALWDGLTLAG
jgi:delta8-fatty-acid desaturase